MVIILVDLHGEKQKSERALGVVTQLSGVNILKGRGFQGGAFNEWGMTVINMHRGTKCEVDE